MTTFAAHRPFLAVLVRLVAVAATSCSTATEGELDTFAGEWCLLRGLGSDGLPRPDIGYIGATLIVEGARVLGSGSTSRPGDPTIFASRFSGDIASGAATITVQDLEDDAETPGPQFVMQLRTEGPRDLVGTMAGDDDFSGSVNLVRLGPRCFVE